MDDVGAAQLSEEQRPIPELSDRRSHVLNSEQAIDRPRRNRIDRNEPGLDFRVVCPGIQEPLRLHGLAAENAHRRDDERDAKTTRWMHKAGPGSPPGRGASSMTSAGAADAAHDTGLSPAVSVRPLPFRGAPPLPFLAPSSAVSPARQFPDSRSGGSVSGGIRPTKKNWKDSCLWGGFRRSRTRLPSDTSIFFVRIEKNSRDGRQSSIGDRRIDRYTLPSRHARRARARCAAPNTIATYDSEKAHANFVTGRTPLHTPSRSIDRDKSRRTLSVLRKIAHILLHGISLAL